MYEMFRELKKIVASPLSHDEAKFFLKREVYLSYAFILLPSRVRWHRELQRRLL